MLFDMTESKAIPHQIAFLLENGTKEIVDFEIVPMSVGDNTRLGDLCKEECGDEAWTVEIYNHAQICCSCKTPDGGYLFDSISDMKKRCKFQKMIDALFTESSKVNQAVKYTMANDAELNAAKKN